jgi:DNA polymerase-1
MRRLFPDNVFVPPKMGDSLRLVIAEAPGEEETWREEPLVGGAGRWFNAILPKAGLTRERLSLTNVISCRPPDNVFPTDPDARRYISQDEGYKSVGHCWENHLLPLLKSRPWQRIDLLGDKPLTFVGGKDDGIFRWRGSPIPVPALGDRLRAVPTLHPAYIMRDQTMLPVVINDLRKSLVLPPENYILTPRYEDVQKFAAKEFAFDIETAFWSTGNPVITMVGLCAKTGESIVVPFKGQFVSELKRIFREATTVIGHNCVQFDLPILQEAGVKISDSCVVYDTMLMQHLRFPDLPHDLEFVGSQFSNKPAWKADKANFELYCARDVDVTWQAYSQLRPMLRQYGLDKLYSDVQVPLARICHLMQKTGFKVDPSRIHAVREKLQSEMAKEEANLPPELRTRQVPVRRRQPAPPGTVSEKTGKPLKYVMVEGLETETPWRSSDVVGKWLYETLKLPVQLDLKTEQVTTGKMALERLYRKTKNRSIDALRKLRKMNSLMTLFCKEQMLGIDRMHPHFNVHGTASGRLSSSDPNLQNVPETARYIYIPSHAGWKIIDVDYSQIENRLTAHFAGDTERMQRFLENPKFSEHKFAASLFFDIPYDEVEKDNDKDAPYGKAKRIVHGSNYGMGAKKISLMYDMDFKETKELQNRWKMAIFRTSQWQERCAEQAKKDGYLATPFGRKRWFYTSSYFTESLSFLPQSTAADVIFRAMIGLMYERIGWPLEKALSTVRVVEPLPQPAKLLLQVHDSLVFEAPAEQVDEVVRVVRKVMEQPWPELAGLVIPIGIKVGDSWGDAEDYVPLAQTAAAA